MARVVITVVGPGRRVDLAVADDTAVAALLPVVLDLCAAGDSGSWTLSPKGGRPLDPERTLRDGGVLHGSVLLLEPRRPPPRMRRPVARAPEVSALPVAELRVVSGPSAGRRVPLEPGEHRVGSHRYARVVLHDAALARVHVVVQVDTAGRVTVAPAAADAACLVGGERLTGPARLGPGQIVAAGRSLLSFGRPGEGSPSPARYLAMAGIDAPRIEAPPVPQARASGVVLGEAAAGTVMAAGVTAAIWGPPAALVPLAVGPVAGLGALAWNRRAHLEAWARFRARLELDHALSAATRRRASR